MYTLSPTFWSWWHGLRGPFIVGYVDATGQAVGFFGRRTGKLIVPMHAIERVLIGFVPARSCLIHYTYLWIAGQHGPFAIRTTGGSPSYETFVRHLLIELERLRPGPPIVLGATVLNRCGTFFVLFGIWVLILVAMAVNELINDTHSLLKLGPAGGLLFLSVGILTALAGWRHDRRWYRPRAYSDGRLADFLPR